MQLTKLHTILNTTLTLALLGAAPAFAQEGGEVTGGEAGTTTMGETQTPPPMDTPPPAMETPAGGRLAVAYAERPLTNGRFILAPSLTFSLTKVGPADPGVGLILGASFGVTNDLDVFVVPVPLVLSPSFTYGDILLGGTFRFMKGNTEVGARVILKIPTSTNFGIAFGVPVDFHFGKSLRLETGLMADMTFSDPLSFALQIPLDFTLQLMPMFGLQLRTGYNLPLAPSGATDLMSIPLGFGAIISLAQGQQPMLDIMPTFIFSSFLTPASGGDAINANIFTLLVSAKFYLYM